MKTLVRPNTTLFPSLPSILEDLFARDWADSTQANNTHHATLPAVNVRETKQEFEIQVAAPGMKKEEFKVELVNNLLTISAEPKNDSLNVNDQETYNRREFNYHSFQRSFSLPERSVEGEKIAARYTDGILFITIPKMIEPKVKATKQIVIG